MHSKNKKKFRRQEKCIETNPFHKNTAGNAVLEIFLSKQDNRNTRKVRIFNILEYTCICYSKITKSNFKTLEALNFILIQNEWKGAL